MIQTFVINLKKDEFRLELFKERFKDITYEIFEGINGQEEFDLYTKWKNKFNYNLDFDWKFYLEKYPELKNYGIVNEKSASKHYIKYGIDELRVINNTCNITNKGQWGCLQSHKKLYEHIQEINKDKEFYRVLILEDDAIPTENFKYKLKEVLSDLEFSNHNIIYLGASQLKWDNINIIPNYDLCYYNAHETSGTFGYIINKKGIEDMLEIISKENKPIDVFLKEDYQTKEDLIVIYPNIITSDLKIKSNIQRKSYNSDLLKEKFRWKNL